MWNRVTHGVRCAALVGLLVLCPAVQGSAAPPSDVEEYMLALINRGRGNPTVEATRFGIDLNEGLAAGAIDPEPKPPLAMNSMLQDAAWDHSEWMLAEDIFSHDGEASSDPGDRMQAAGYAPSTNGQFAWGENIAWQGTTAPLNDALIRQMVEGAYRGLFLSPGHRLNTMEPIFREIGVGIATGSFYAPGNDGIYRNWNSVMVSQDFARESGVHCLTGAAFEDLDHSSLYSPGEGYGDVRVSAIRHSDGAVFQTTTWPSGGYSLELPDGTYDVVATSDEFGFRWLTNIPLDGANVSLNFVPEPDGRARMAALALSVLLLRRSRSH